MKIESGVFIMKKSFKKISYFCFVIFVFTNITVFGFEKEGIITSSYNSYISEDSGYLPRPVEIKKGAEPTFTSFNTRFNLLGAGEIPTTYDLRNQGLVTSVKNQNPTGTCWTFAGMSALESALLKNKLGNPYDYSEANLNYALTKYTSDGENNSWGYDRALNSGGNFGMVMAYLSRGSGPVLEKNDIFVSGVTPAPRLASVTNSKLKEKYATKMYQLPNLPSNYTDTQRQAQITKTKQFIIDFGVAFCSYYTASSYYNATNTAYYYPYSGTSQPNHAVSIIGWDDNYSKTNFKTQPTGDGAFLIKNSWGSNWGNQGYFWLSYYDKYVANDVSCVAEVKNVKEYDNIYQYDPLGVISELGLGETSVIAANKFTSIQSGEILKAVGFDTIEENQEYEIYVNKNGHSLNSETLIKVAEGKLEDRLAYAGHHTIDIPEQIINGTSFAIAVKLISSGIDGALFPMEMRLTETTTETETLKHKYDYSTKATSNPNEGFICFDTNIPTPLNENGYWFDVDGWYKPYSFYDGENNRTLAFDKASVCIKALTDNPTSSVSFYNGNDEVITSTTEDDTVVSNIKVRNANANTKAVLATYEGNKLYNIEYKTGLTNNDINVFNSTLPSGTGYTFKTILLDENTLKPLINNGYSITK
jgi:C1A family cysteine protease